ncbi:MAG: M16 family metallopeptidase [Vicinamibacterales bacterium]
MSLSLLAAGAASAQVSVPWPSERPPAPLAPREVQFPPYELKTLANGMQVIAVAHHEQPIVSLRLLVKTGAVNDPEGKTGVSSLASVLLDQGTTTRSAQDIANQIDFIGGALGTGSGSDLTFVNALVMKDSFDFGLELLNDVVRNPAFADEELDRQKQQIISSLQVNEQDPDYIAATVFDRLVWGFHPYGVPASGTAETLAAITRADLQAYHRAYFVPNNMILAVVGDIQPAEAFAAVEKVFGGWARAEVPAIRAAEPPPPTRRIVIIDRPDAVQTEIRVGQLAIPRRHPDYMAWDLAVKVLGGEGGNRLHQVLRSARGLTYGASADTEARKYGGSFVAETDTRTETTAEALRLMVDEFSRLQRERVRQIELSGAQDYLSGSFPLTIETPNEIATQILNVLFYELPVGEIGTFRERVTAVTPDDIQRVAREYIRPDRLSIVLVGNARFFVQQLSQMGFSGMEIIPVNELDLTSPTLRGETRRAGLPPEGGSYVAAGGVNVAVASVASGFSRKVAFAPQAATAAARLTDPALELINRVIRVKGGLGPLKNVRSVVADAQTTLRLEQPLVSTTRTYVVYPGKFRVDATVNGAEVVQVFNAGAAWVRDPGGVHDAPTAMRDDFAAAVERDIIPLLIAAAEGRVTARLLPDEGRGDAALKVLELRGPQLPPTRLYINQQMLVARQAYSTPGPDGTPVQVEELFSDYRPVEGIRVPFEASVRRDGRPLLDRTLTRMVINGPVDDTLFARPQQ